MSAVRPSSLPKVCSSVHQADSRGLIVSACNHITCECGNEFCYICGKPWAGYHSCPRYGVPVYDEDGYNQDGYHRDTGLDREGRTRREATTQRLPMNEEEEGDEGGETEEQTIQQQIWGRLDRDQQAMLDALDPQTRQEALDQLMVQFVNEGVVFEESLPGAQAQQPDGEDDNEEDEVVDGQDINLLFQEADVGPPGSGVENQDEEPRVEDEEAGGGQNAVQELPIYGVNPGSNLGDEAPGLYTHVLLPAQHPQPIVHASDGSSFPQNDGEPLSQSG